jgi:hypothetical protein
MEEVAEEVSRLKEKPALDILVAGRITLVNTAVTRRHRRGSARRLSSRARPCGYVQERERFRLVVHRLEMVRARMLPAGHCIAAVDGDRVDDA